MSKYIQDEELENIIIEYMIRNEFSKDHMEFIMQALHTLELKTRYETIQEIKDSIQLDSSIMILTSSSKYLQ